jgi:hypothetical protein
MDVSTEVYQAIIETFTVQYQGKDKLATEKMEEREQKSVPWGWLVECYW